jgi:hypothetical protein
MDAGAIRMTAWVRSLSISLQQSVINKDTYGHNGDLKSVIDLRNWNNGMAFTYGWLTGAMNKFKSAKIVYQRQYAAWKTRTLPSLREPLPWTSPNTRCRQLLPRRFACKPRYKNQVHLKNWRIRRINFQTMNRSYRRTAPLYVRILQVQTACCSLLFFCHARTIGLGTTKGVHLGYTLLRSFLWPTFGRIERRDIAQLYHECVTSWETTALKFVPVQLPRLDSIGYTPITHNWTAIQHCRIQ